MEKSIFTHEYRVLVDMLRETRRGACITQVELGENLGETQSVVSKWERGERRLDVVQLRKICEALGTTLPAFVRRYEKRLVEKRG